MTEKENIFVILEEKKPFYFRCVKLILTTRGSSAPQPVSQ